jgi:hypothetical protein
VRVENRANVWLYKIQSEGIEMKIQPKHYQYLMELVDDFIDMNPIMSSDYKEAGLSETRFLFDVLYALKINDFICDTLYLYLDDTHLHTALKRINKELEIF